MPKKNWLPHKMKLYLLMNSKLVKVGISRNVGKRVGGINSAMPFDIDIAVVVTGPEDSVVSLESLIKAKMPGRVKGEWFSARRFRMDRFEQMFSRYEGMTMFVADEAADFVKEEAAQYRAIDITAIQKSREMSCAHYRHTTLASGG